jgi:hypothetical protein
MKCEWQSKRRIEHGTRWLLSTADGLSERALPHPASSASCLSCSAWNRGFKWAWFCASLAPSATHGHRSCRGSRSAAEWRRAPCCLSLTTTETSSFPVRRREMVRVNPSISHVSKSNAAASGTVGPGPVPAPSSAIEYGSLQCSKEGSAPARGGSPDG